MPFCAVFGCSSDSKRDKGISWFRFPKDTGRCKIWLHYCRRADLKLSEHSRMCSKHFSEKQLARNPMKMLEYGYSGARISLKDDAIPDIPMDHSTVEKPRGAFAKRRKLEILGNALDEAADNASTHTVELDPSSDLACSSQESSASCSTDTDDLVTLAHLKIQTEPVKTRTRRIQTRSVGVVDVGVQCDLLNPKPHETTEPSLLYEEYGEDISAQDLLSSTVIEDHTEEQDLINSSFYSNISDALDDEDLDPNFDPDSDLMDSSEDQDSDDDPITNYRLEKTADQLDEKYYLVSESSLTELLSACRLCGTDCTSFIEFTRGSMIATSSVCSSGHITRWQSQTMTNKLPWGNLLISSAIILSGCNTSKVLRMFDHMKLQMLSQRTAARLQSAYTIPATLEEFDSKQADIIQDLGDKDLVLGGDGRCDSPGYSAKFGCYTLMDLETSKIVDVRLIQSNEVRGSTHMELEGLKRGLEYLTGVGRLNITALVTDRHVMIKKYMRENQPTISHYFDVWHIAKGVSKKLEAAAKKKDAGNIRPWIKSIVNHAYWVAATSGDNAEMKLAKWKSITNHIRNIHEHETEVFPKCEHGEFEVDRTWLINGSRCFKLVRDVVESPYLLRDIPKLSPVHQTYGLEVFHSVVNQFAPKSTHFFYASMMARTYVAALHFNENGSRRQASTKDGEARWRKAFPKAKKGEHCVVKAQREPATYDYVRDLLRRIFDRRTQYDSINVATEDFRVGFNQPAALTTAYQDVDKDQLVRERRSRFL